MAAPEYKVNGVNFLPYIKNLVIEENDVDSDDSGRTLDGLMHRGRIASKDKHTIDCRPLYTDESKIVLQAISGSEFVSVQTNIHPKYTNVVLSMYNSSRTAAVYRVDEDGKAVWDNISFTLIER